MSATEVMLEELVGSGLGSGIVSARPRRRGAPQAARRRPTRLSELERGEIAYRAGRYAEAAEEFDAAFQVSASGTALAGKAAALRMQGLFELGEAILVHAPDELRRDPAVLTEQGWALVARSRYAKAESAFRSALEQAPGSAAAARGLIHVLRRRGRLAAARQAADDHAKLKDASLRTEIGWLRLTEVTADVNESTVSKQLAPARRQFEAAYRYDPDDPHALAGYVAIHVWSGDDAAAERLLRERLAGSEDTSLLLIDGWMKSIRNDVAGACSQFDAILQRLPKVPAPATLKAQSLRREGRVQEALAVVRDARKHHPRDVGLLAERGWALHAQAHHQAAVNDFRAAIARDRQSWSAWAGLAAALRRLAAMKAHSDVMLKLSGPDRRYYEGCGHASNREFELARADFEGVLELEPDNAVALAGVAYVDRLAGRTPAALDVITPALADGPDNPVSLVEYGWILYAEAQYHRAEMAFNSALRVLEDYLPAIEGKASAVRLQGRFEAARKILDPALEHHPGNGRLLAERGWLENDQGRHRTALRYFESAFAAGFHDVFAIQGMAVAYRGLGELDAAAALVRENLAGAPVALGIEQGWISFDRGSYDEAVDHFNAVLAQEADNTFALHGKYSALMHGGRFGEARAGLENALAGMPRGAKDLTRRGVGPATEVGWLFYRAKDYEPAIASFDVALDIAPDHAYAIEGKACALRMLGRFDEAEKLLAPAVAAAEGHCRLQTEMGWLLYAQRRYKEAVERFESALRGEAESPVALQGKARSLRMLHKWDEAENVVKSFPNQSFNPTADIERGWISIWRAAYGAGSYDEALAHFRHAHNMDRTNVHAIEGEATALRYKASAGLNSSDCIDAAKALLEDALPVDHTQIEPSQAALLTEYGWLHLTERDLATARPSFATAIEKNPWLPFAHEGYVATLRMQRNYTAAEAALDSALAYLPNNPDLLRERATLAFDRHKYSEAITACGAALKVDPDSGFVLSLRLAAMRRAGTVPGDEMRLAVAHARARAEEDADVLCELGWFELEHGDDQIAAAAFERAAVGPRANRRQQARATLGRMEVLLRQRASTARLESLRVGFEDEPEVRDRFGRVYLRQHELAKADAEYAAILNQDPRDLRGLAGKGAVALEQHDPDSAERYFLEARRHDPDEPAYTTGLAWCHVIRAADDVSAELDEAEVLCRKAISLAARNHDAHLCLGVIARRRGRLREAEDHYLAAIEADGDGAANTELGALYAAIGRIRDADPYLEHALEVNPDDARVHAELAVIRRDSGDVSEAIHEFRQAVALNPGQAGWHCALAHELEQHRSPAEAERVLRTALMQVERSRTASVHLALCSLLARRAEQLDDDDHLYEEAETEASKAIELQESADAYFWRGVVRAKMRHFRRARRDFQRAVHKDSTHYEARRYLNRLRDWVDPRQLSERGGWVIGSLACVQLILLWALFLSGRVSATMVSTLAPVLVGLVVVAVLLPTVIRFRMPGLEAQLSAPLQEVKSAQPLVAVPAAAPPVHADAVVSLRVVAVEQREPPISLPQTST